MFICGANTWSDTCGFLKFWIHQIFAPKTIITKLQIFTREPCCGSRNYNSSSSLFLMLNVLVIFFKGIISYLFLHLALSAFKAVISALALSSFSCKTLSCSCMGIIWSRFSFNWVWKFSTWSFKRSLSSRKIRLESLKAGMVCTFSNNWEYLDEGNISL